MKEKERLACPTKVQLDRMFPTLITEKKAEKFDCLKVTDELKQATLVKALVGSDKRN